MMSVARQFDVLSSPNEGIYVGWSNSSLPLDLVPRLG